MTPPRRHDVVIVGARCAGAPLAVHLARAGLSVALVDRATFPSDTPSTHIFEAEGVAALGRLGVVDDLLATGAPWLERARLRFEDVWAELPWPCRDSDPGPALSVRRPLLDTILVEAAHRAGAVVHPGTRVHAIEQAGGRVTGVRAGSGGDEVRLEAPLVIGADGRASTVARLVGARTYNVAPNQRFGYWGYYESVPWERPATIDIQRWDDEFVMACPTDSGLYLVIVIPPLERLATFRADVEASFDEHVRRAGPVADLVAGGRRVGPPQGMASYSGYFRESAGPGWGLVGDAGHFKDPSPGQGISDALRQSERLADAIVGAGHDQAATDAALRRWWQWRDRDAWEMHWFAHDVGAAGPAPIVFAEIVRHMATGPHGLRAALEVFNHRLPPSHMLTPARLAGAATRLVASRRQPAGVVLREVRDIAREELRRRWRNHHPVYTSRSPVLDPDEAPAPAS